MDVDNIYGSTFSCECGKTHGIMPSQVVYEKGACEKLPELLRRAGVNDDEEIIVLMDGRTSQVAGENVVAEIAVAGFRPVPLVLEDKNGHSPVCDDITFAELKTMLGTPKAFVPVGSGVINDLAKWLASDSGVPYVTFATAASMNGYASANIAPTLKGVKSIVDGKPPFAVVSDPEIMQNAPHEMTVSGLGDILAKSVSSVDWKLNHILFGDYYCARSVELIKDIEPLYIENPEGVGKGEPVAIEALFKGLLLTGVAMTMAETSFPASGAEHMVSHTLDMMSSVDGTPHDLHGRQVGVGTILASEVYSRVLALENPEFVEVDFAIEKKFWGPLGESVQKCFDGKADRYARAAEILKEKNNWDNLKKELGGMVREAKKIKSVLSRAGGAVYAEDIGIENERLATAFAHAHEIRSRFTVLDLARMMGILPKANEDILSLCV